MSASELTVELVGLAPDHALPVARGVLDETTARRPSSRQPLLRLVATGDVADSAVADLHEQVYALQTQLLRERAETARLRDEVAQLRTQTREDFELTQPLRKTLPAACH